MALLLPRSAAAEAAAAATEDFSSAVDEDLDSIYFCYYHLHESDLEKMILRFGL